MHMSQTCTSMSRKCVDTCNLNTFSANLTSPCFQNLKLTQIHKTEKSHNQGEGDHSNLESLIYLFAMSKHF